MENYFKLFLFGVLFCALSACGNQSAEEKAQENALNYLLEKRRDVLVLDTAEFSPLQSIQTDSLVTIEDSKPPRKAKPVFTISYFSIRQRKKGMIQIPVMAQFKFDSVMNVIDFQLHEQKTE